MIDTTHPPTLMCIQEIMRWPAMASTGMPKITALQTALQGPHKLYTLCLG